MTYELCKQLKDAGFPQVGSGYYLLGTGMGEISYFTNPPDLRDYEHKIPTLSELIAACLEIIPDKFLDLKSRNYTDSQWIATSNWKIGGGYTPEEAVAKLWLELNKKD